jgi:ankyrin
MFAANRGELTIVENMIKHGVNLDAQRHDGWTAMHFAAREGNTDIARALKNAGASTTIKDRRGRSPLYVAKSRGRTNIVAIMNGTP